MRCEPPRPRAERSPRDSDSSRRRRRRARSGTTAASSGCGARRSRRSRANRFREVQASSTFRIACAVAPWPPSEVRDVLPNVDAELERHCGAVTERGSRACPACAPAAAQRARRGPARARTSPGWARAASRHSAHGVRTELRRVRMHAVRRVRVRTARSAPVATTVRTRRRRAAIGRGRP